MPYKILIPQPVAPEGVEFLEDQGYEILMGTGVSEETLLREVADCDAVLLRTAPFDGKILEAGKRLQVVARHGAGYNNVDLETAARLGIWVTNTPDATTSSVAEFTLGALICCARNMAACSRRMKEGEFSYKNTHKGMDLRGKTLAVIGFGRIGQEVAKKAHLALGMRILAYSPSLTPEKAPEYAEAAEWEKCFREADFVSLHMPLKESTRGIVGEKEFSMMKPTARLINCARGEVVKEAELIRALETGEIGGAFLDVFEKEPPQPDNPLFSMENVTVTPHMASNTEECMALMARQAAEQIHQALSGKRPSWAVNRPEHPRNILKNH